MLTNRPDRLEHPTAVLVQPDGNYGFIYQIDASAIHATDERGIQAEMKHIINPVSGGMVIDHYARVKNEAGKQVYEIWAHR